MTKPRKSRHNGPPSWYTPLPESISEHFQAEVDATTNRLERAYAAAEKRLATARTKAERLALEGATSTRTAAAWVEVEKRETELREIRLLMQPSNTAPARNRGHKSFRKIPDLRTAS